MIALRYLSVVLGFLVILIPPQVIYAQFPEQWTEDPDNPISPGFGGSTVIFHDGIYKCWGDAPSGVQYGTSPDGRTWTLHPDSPVLQEGPEWYDLMAIDNPTVVVVDDEFHMFYSGIAADNDNRIAYATSTDGIDWTKHPDNPVLDKGPPGSIDSGELIHPCVIHEDGFFRIWYNAVADAPGDSPQNIAQAYSADGVVWTRFAAPALIPGEQGEWDSTGLYMMNVIRYLDSYFMFYTGGMGDIDGGTGVVQIGLATSPDAINWTKRSPSEPVIPVGGAGEWDSAAVAIPVVMVRETDIVMWYFGGQDLQNIYWGMASAEPDPNSWLEVVIDKNLGAPGTHFVWMGANKAGATSGTLVTPRNTYPMISNAGYWGVPNQFYSDHSSLSYWELMASLDTWTLTWDPGSPISETVCTIEFGSFTGVEFPGWATVTMPQDSRTIVDPDPNPPTFTWHYGAVDPCVAVPDFSEVALVGPDDQEIKSGELPCETTSWTPAAPLAPGEWMVLVGNVLSDVRDVPEGLTMTGDPWPLANDDWLSFRSWGIPLDLISDVPQIPGAGAAVRLIGNTPNPFNPQTTISFEVYQPGPVTLRVFDMAGRLVKELVAAEVIVQGLHEVTWNGKDDSGRKAASGTYFYRLEAGSFGETKRMVLLK